MHNLFNCKEMYAFLLVIATFQVRIRLTQRVNVESCNQRLFSLSINLLIAFSINWLVKSKKKKKNLKETF